MSTEKKNISKKETVESHKSSIKEWKNSCQRCGKFVPGEACGPLVMISKFKIELICNECCEKEKIHPEYKNAIKAFHDAINRDDINFSGIGLPSDLKPKQ